MYQASEQYRYLIDNKIRGQWSARFESAIVDQEYNVDDTVSRPIQDTNTQNIKGVIGSGLTDGTIPGDSIKSITKTSPYMTGLSFGNVISSYVNVSLYDNTIRLQDEVLKLIISLNNEDIPLGIYTVYEAPTKDEDTLQFIAYDNVRRLGKEYETQLAYPTTALNVVNEVMSLCGVDIDCSNVDLSFTINEKIEVQYCTDVMSEIAKAVGKNIVAGRDGKLKFIWFEKTEIKIDADMHFNFEVVDQAFTLNNLICTSNEDILVAGVDGTGMSFNSPYVTQQMLNIIYEESKLSYHGAKANFVGDPTIDIGDIVKISNINGFEYDVPIMQDIFTYDGGCNNDIEAYAVSATETELGSDENARKKIFDLQKTIDGLRLTLQKEYYDKKVLETVIDIEAGKLQSTVTEKLMVDVDNQIEKNSVIMQLSDRVLVQLDNNGNLTCIDMESGETSTIKIKADNISLEGLITANGNITFTTDGRILTKIDDNTYTELYAGRMFSQGLDGDSVKNVDIRNGAIDMQRKDNGAGKKFRNVMTSDINYMYNGANNLVYAINTLANRGDISMPMYFTNLFLGNKDIYTVFSQLGDWSSLKNKSGGYLRMEEGIILQWGGLLVSTTPNTTSQFLITFPITFPNRCAFVMPTAATSGPSNVSVSCSAMDSGSADLYFHRNTTTATGIRWFAIGW